MIRQTYGDLAPELSRVAGTTGLAVDDPLMLTRFNRATMELMNAGDWPGVVDRWKFRIFDGRITLPGDLDRLMGICVDGRPVEMRAPWYEFAAGGPGIEDERRERAWLMLDRPQIVVDRSEVCTLNPVPNDGSLWSLALVADMDERVATVRPNLLVHGYDGATGQWLRSAQSGAQADGILLAINGDSGTKTTTSPSAVSAVTGIQKPVTNGYVHLYAVNGTMQVHLSTYAPIETRPSYRQYFLPTLRSRFEHGHAVIARCRRRYVPVQASADFVIISNVNAMEAMILAQWHRETGDMAGYAANRQAAVGLMTEESVSYHGKTKNPSLTFADGFAIGDIPFLQ